jgi:hypothetical protein
MPEINSSLFSDAYLDNAFPGTASQSDASFDFCTMFGSLPGGGSPQEMFISPLENVLSMDSQNTYASLAPTNAYAHISSSNSPVPPSTYSGSPAPSDFSLSLHSHAQPQPQRIFEAMASQAQAKSTMANLDVDMAAYTQGLANFNIPLDMGLSYVVPEMPPLSFDISEHMFTSALQGHQPHQQQQQVHLPIAAPVAVPVDNSFAFNDIINEF